ncbi:MULTISPECIES: DUF5701 family protein [Streptomyces]|uniref:DUF5701 family protein n=1 Tax=Streptomyces TaxID=1883 RepID=UPI0016772742|nr:MULTISPECIES: DUF5701 family protein [Streptomyces]MBD3575512.1 hypothetical protein [Streptomyces sp. KD18]GGT22367.1 hypothetical protein GCM10010286_54860 [Streptomyces toxytricini]
MPENVSAAASDASSASAAVPLPSLAEQAERLIGLGVPEVAGIPADRLRAYAVTAGGDGGDLLLAVHPDLAPASVLAPLLRHGDKPGFVVTDMADVDRFTPDGIDLPDAPLYVVAGPDRGDRMANWSPEEALPALHKEDRTPLLLTEGIHWLLQQPAVLERNRCFMTIGSRLRKPNGSFDARTPAIWISNGTGRDGRERRNAPKVGWCWWNNRHTWLGFASTTGRRP